MPEITLNAQLGRKTGSSDSRRLRTAGRIPGVLYGHGMDPIALSVEAKELRSALSTNAGLHQLLEIHADGQSYLAIARELQRHPVRGTVSHVDFVIVQRDEFITSDVTINVVGDAVDVRRNGGSVDQELFTLHVKAQPQNVPSSIDVDVSSLTVGGAIRVADLVLPAGVEAAADGDIVVVASHASRVAADAEAPAEA
jgi:large subunit ribosomal protein L25